MLQVENINISEKLNQDEAIRAFALLYANQSNPNGTPHELIMRDAKLIVDYIKGIGTGIPTSM